MKKVIIFIVLFTFVPCILMPKGPPPRNKEKSRYRQKERNRRNSSFFRFHSEQSILDFIDSSTNNI